MSEKYNATVAALSTNEELRTKVMGSSSAEERAGTSGLLALKSRRTTRSTAVFIVT